MKSSVLSLVTCASAVALLSPLCTSHAVDAKPLRILIVDGQNNHNWKATTPVLLETLSRSGRFEVIVSTAPAKGQSQEVWNQWNPNFEGFAAVVSNYNGELWPEPVQRAFEGYVSKGGGFVCVHAANNSFPEWLEYNKMIGLGGWGGRNEKNGPLVYRKDGSVVRDTAPGNGGGHGPQHEFTVELLDKDHPITKGLPIKWKHTSDELYHALRGPAENLNLLGVAHSPVTQRDEPMLITLSYGKGRVFHTPMGHSDVSMKCAGFQTVLERGTEWAASGAVTIQVPKDFPSEEATAPRN